MANELGGTALAAAVVTAASFLGGYLLTALPFLGLGVLDAAVIALIADRGAADASELVAGLISWRVCVQLVPLALGGGALAWWKLRSKPPVAAAT